MEILSANDYNTVIREGDTVLKIRSGQHRKTTFRGMPGTSLSLEEEAHMHERLFSIGLPFPKPHGITTHNTHDNKLPVYAQGSVQALAMDYVPGLTPIPDTELETALKQANNALQLAHAHNLRPFDDNKENVLWNPRTNQIILVDAEFWGTHWGPQAAYTKKLLTNHQRYQTSHSSQAL